MILDRQNIFSDGQAVTGASGTNVISTDVIDLGAVGTPPWRGGTLQRLIGQGEPVELAIHVSTAFVGAGASVAFELVGDDNAAMSSPTVLATTGPIPIASLVLGFRPPLTFLPDRRVNERFLALRYAITGAAVSAGNVFAAIVSESVTTPGATV